MADTKKKQMYIIKKDGTKEEFNAQKIIVAVNKSASRILYKFSQEEIDFICEFATERAEARKATRFRFYLCATL